MVIWDKVEKLFQEPSSLLLVSVSKETHCHVFTKNTHITWCKKMSVRLSDVFVETTELCGLQHFLTDKKRWSEHVVSWKVFTLFLTNFIQSLKKVVVMTLIVSFTSFPFCSTWTYSASTLLTVTDHVMSDPSNTSLTYGTFPALL